MTAAGFDPGRLNALLATPALRLEPLAAAHADETFPHLLDPALYRWMSVARPSGLEQLRARYARLAGRMSPDGSEIWLNWAIRDLRTEAVGGLIDVALDGRAAVNVGYTIFTASAGRGVATAALQAVLAHLDAAGVAFYRALVTDGHLASMRVLEKCGFVRTGRLKDNEMLDGVAYDDIVFERHCPQPASIHTPAL